jgi:hypothetical protein
MGSADVLDEVASGLLTTFFKVLPTRGRRVASSDPNRL